MIYYHLNLRQFTEDVLYVFPLLCFSLSHEIHTFSVIFQLSNIIWGEAGEAEDHIVPFEDAYEGKTLDSCGGCTKKEQNQEAVNKKPAEQKKPVIQSDLHGVKLDEGLPATEFSVASWPDLPSQSAAETDQSTMGTEAFNNVTDISKHDSRSGANLFMEIIPFIMLSWYSFYF